MPPSSVLYSCSAPNQGERVILVPLAVSSSQYLLGKNNENRMEFLSTVITFSSGSMHQRNETSFNIEQFVPYETFSQFFSQENKILEPS